MKRDDGYLKELLSDVSMDSLLLIDKKGRLRRVYCPFRVKSRVEFPRIKKGQVVMVEELAITTDLKDVYMIGQRPYYSIHFMVLLE